MLKNNVVITIHLLYNLKLQKKIPLKVQINL